MDGALRVLTLAAWPEDGELAEGDEVLAVI
jgi:hypothetical protein